MSDNPTAQATPVDADATSQADTTTQTASVQATVATVDDLPDWARKEIKALRKEAETYRRAAKEREQAEMSDAQRYKAQLDELLGTHSAALQELRSLKAQGLARDAGAIYPDLVADRISDDALNGDKQARDKEIDRLRKQYPGLFRTGSADGGARGDASTALDMNDFIRRAVTRR